MADLPIGEWQGTGLIRNQSRTTNAGGSLQLLVFLLEEQRYALPLAIVDRVERIVAVTALPRAPEGVLGVINVRGQVVPVFDLHRRFRLPERLPELTDRLVVARTSRRPIALRVDTVQDVQDRPADQIIPAERVLPGLEYIRGVVRLEDGMVLIHDLDRFLSLEEEQQLEQAMERR
jgi:purine-binding chemotaxis protein CheW